MAASNVSPEIDRTILYAFSGGSLTVPKEEINPKEDINLEKVQTAVCKAIKHSQQIRDSKINNDLAETITSLGKDLNKLDDLCLENCINQDEITHLQDRIDHLMDNLPSTNLDNDELDEITEEEIDKITEEIATYEAQNITIEDEIKSHKILLKERYVGLEIQNGFFSDWHQLSRINAALRPLSLSFMREQLINRCINNKIYMNDSKTALEKHKHDIFIKFSGIEKVNDIEVIIPPTLDHSETHNKGRFPFQATLKASLPSGQEHSINIFYKPRQAHLDKAIMDLFRQLNALPSESKSIDVEIFTYQIVSLSEHVIPSSIWDYIEGYQFDGLSANDFIQSLEDPAKKACLRKQLLRLESICNYLGISDLHPENIRFKDFNKENPIIALIDLESIQPGCPTGLFSNICSEIPPLTPKEKDLLDNFKTVIESLPIRFIPILTSSFLGGLTRCNTFIPLASQLKKVITRQGFTLTVKLEELEWFILTDFLNNDVPFLTEYRSAIYYGLYTGTEQDKLIANKT